MDIKDVKELIKFVSRAGVSEVKYKDGNMEISIKTGIGGTNYVQTQPTHVNYTPIIAPQEITTSEQVVAAPVVENNSNLITIKSPMIGTFYRKPSPDKDVFVNVGDSIEKGKVVCVIEAMKLFNEIESEISGKIVKILVEDSTPVEYDQPLFLVEPN